MLGALSRFRKRDGFRVRPSTSQLYPTPNCKACCGARRRTSPGLFGRCREEVVGRRRRNTKTKPPPPWPLYPAQTHPPQQPFSQVGDPTPPGREPLERTASGGEDPRGWQAVMISGRGVVRGICWGVAFFLVVELAPSVAPSTIVRICRTGLNPGRKQAGPDLRGPSSVAPNDARPPCSSTPHVSSLAPPRGPSSGAPVSGPLVTSGVRP